MITSSVAIQFLIILVISIPRFGASELTQDLDSSVISVSNGTGCLTARNETGACMDIKQCRNFIDLLVKDRNHAPTISYIKGSVCGNTKENNTAPNICCPLNTLGRSLQTHPPCGYSKIFEGESQSDSSSKKGKWPWLVLLGYKKSDKDKIKWLCGGSIINSKFILTSAQCTGIKDFKLKFVRVREFNFENKPEDGITPIDIPVKGVLINPNFNSATYSNDIALIKLENEIEFNKYAQPICLPKKNMGASTNTYYRFIGAGWGTSPFGDPPTSMLEEGQLSFVNTTDCQKTYGEKNINFSQLCAIGNVEGNHNFQRCNELYLKTRQSRKSTNSTDYLPVDFGGPLMLRRKYNFYVLGINSFGCLQPGHPIVTTKVTEFVDWINENIK